MKSKTLIEKQLQRKTNSALVETIIACKKNSAWNEIAGILSGSRGKRKEINLENLNKINDKKILVPGKVLSSGEITNKTKIIALNFSEKAKEKILKSGCEISNILEEIKSNPSAKGIFVLK